MQRETEIACCPIRIEDDVIHIGSRSVERSFHRDHAPALIAFIQAWLDHDPEQELHSKVDGLRSIGMTVGGDFSKATEDIIQAVREHDARYRREV